MRRQEGIALAADGGMNQRFEPLKRFRGAEHPLRQSAAIDSMGAGGAGESRFDLGDKRALRSLKPMNHLVGVEHRNPFVGEHLRDRRLAHSDRAGESQPQCHDVSRPNSSRSMSGPGLAPKKSSNA